MHTQQGLHLPKINRKVNSKSHFLIQQPSARLDTLQIYLESLRKGQESFNKNKQRKQKENKKKMLQYAKTITLTTSRQIKKNQEKERVVQRIIDNKKEQQSIINLVKYQTLIKPPHRYKTTIIVFQQFLILFGGLGCDKHLSWAKLNLKTLEWIINPIQDTQKIVMYGHTMGYSKGYAYIFGGIRVETTTNDFMALNVKNMSTINLNPGPYRRRQHAMTFLSKYMMIHGGLEGNQLKNNLFYYDTQNGRWIIPPQVGLPYLSHHSIISLYQKNKKKGSTFQDTLGQTVFIFGGKDYYSAQNKLYRLKVKQTGQLTAEEVIASGIKPEPRYSSCVQLIQSGYIFVYGGKSNDQIGGINKQNGVYNDCFLYSIQKKEWTRPICNDYLGYRFGSASFAIKNKIYIFGGNQSNGYSDANVIELNIKTHNQQQKEEELGSRLKLR